MASVRDADGWDGERYQARLQRQLADNDRPHGEADLVTSYHPRSVLDAGCGTGRVAIELARRGLDVTGVDLDPSMLATARRLAPELSWVHHDLATLDLGRSFDVVLLAGNVPLFADPATTGDVVAACARHLAADGVMIAGFQLARPDGVGAHYGVDRYDREASAAGLRLVERYRTWDLDAFNPDADYAVSIQVHR